MLYFGKFGLLLIEFNTVVERNIGQRMNCALVSGTDDAAACGQLLGTVSAPTCHTRNCKKCGMCLKPGCPALTKNADGTISIDATMCNGCGLCQGICKFDAIETVEA